jgi:sulfopyruvate decarboxylase subunit alpha
MDFYKPSTGLYCGLAAAGKLEGDRLLEHAAREAMAGLKGAGIDFVSGLPDGWQRNLHELIADDPDFRYVPVCNEGVGFSVCAGAWLGGRKPVLIMENSGLRVAAEYIARISLGAGVPVTLMLSYRGDIGETEHWGIPHGIVAEPLLDALRIKYQIVRDPADLRQAIIRAHRLSEAQLHPAAVLVSGSCVWED